MRESEKLIKFKLALKKGKEGVPDNFEAWLQSYGIDFKKISLKYVQEYFANNLDNIIGNEKAIEIIGEYIGLYLRNPKNFYHIPIIGINGSGKTTLQIAIQKYIEQSGEEIKFQMFNASKFHIDMNEILYYDKNEFKPQKYDVVFVDSCEQDKYIFDSFTCLFEKIGNAVYITAWTPEVFNYWSNDIEYSYPFSRKIIIYPFGNKNFKLTEFSHHQSLLSDHSQFIKRVIRAISLEKGKSKENTKEIFGEHEFDALGALFNYSKGIPSISIKLLFNSIRETFRKRREELEVKTILDAARKMGIISIPKVLNQLSPPQIRLLETMLVFSSKDGINPTKLAKELGLDKSTVSYYLNLLKDLEILESKQTGRMVDYKIKENLIPYIQIKILIEFDYLQLNNKEKSV